MIQSMQTILSGIYDNFFPFRFNQFFSNGNLINKKTAEKLYTATIITMMSNYKMSFPEREKHRKRHYVGKCSFNSRKMRFEHQ